MSKRLSAKSTPDRVAELSVIPETSGFSFRWTPGAGQRVRLRFKSAEGSENLPVDDSRVDKKRGIMLVPGDRGFSQSGIHPLNASQRLLIEPGVRIFSESRTAASLADKKDRGGKSVTVFRPAFSDTQATQVQFGGAREPDGGLTIRLSIRSGW